MAYDFASCHEFQMNDFEHGSGNFEMLLWSDSAHISCDVQLEAKHCFAHCIRILDLNTRCQT